MVDVKRQAEHDKQHMIRPYEDRDLNDVLDVWNAATRLAHPFLDNVFLRDERKAIAEVYLPMAETWVFILDTGVVGFIALLGDEVGGLYVAPDHHGQGIGRQLVDHARGLRGHLEVEVFKANTLGRRFYDRYGFVLMKERIHEETGQPLLRLKWSGG